jgi:methionyl-tRNA synthetase
MSKTAGTTVTLSEAIDRYGADALRYFLLREVGFDNDGDFTWERFDARYTSELADTIGNLVSRALTMIVNYRGGTVPRDPRSYDTPLEVAARGALAAYARAMDANRLQEGAAQLVALASAANRYVEETAPYKLAKQPDKTAELDSVLANLARTVARIAVLAQPFLPATAATVWATVGSPPPGPLERVRLGDVETLEPAGRQVQKPPILFPKPRLAPA